METVKEKKTATKDMQEMMKKYRELGTPSAPHRQLAKMEGSWTTKTRSWQDPSLPPRESTGTSEQKMILDGRFLQNTETGDMMGTPFTGIGLTGYDNFTGKYITIWMSSASTSVFYAEGTASAEGNSVEYESGSMATLMGPMKFRIVTGMIDNNNFRFEMYGTGKSGRENKLMETIYTRKA